MSKKKAAKRPADKPGPLPVIPIDVGPVSEQKPKFKQRRDGMKPHVDPEMDKAALELKRRTRAETKAHRDEVSRLKMVIKNLEERIADLESVHPRDIDPSDRPEAVLRAKVNMDFSKCLRLPPGILRSGFRADLFQSLHGYYPALHRSSARMLFEGRVPGYPDLSAVISNLPIMYRRDFCDILDFMDLLETLVQRKFLSAQAEPTKSLAAM